MSGVFNRVIPCLLLQDGGLVKTERFKKPKYVGDPINAIRIFNDKYVDELIFLDISASRLNKEPDYDLIARIASDCSPQLHHTLVRVRSHREVVFLYPQKVAGNKKPLL